MSECIKILICIEIIERFINNYIFRFPKFSEITFDKTLLRQL